MLLAGVWFPHNIVYCSQVVLPVSHNRALIEQI